MTVDPSNMPPPDAPSPEEASPVAENVSPESVSSENASVENVSPVPEVAPEEKRRQLEGEALPLMDLVYSVARRMVGDEAKAEDLVQETYLRAFRSVDQYKLGTNCKAWLLTILRSVYIDASRHVQARGGTHEQLPADIFAMPERTDLPIDPARFMSILDLMVDDDIRDAMLQLPDLYREAFVMVVIAELPYKEAATVLAVQEGTVKSRVFRACQMLKQRLWNYAVDRRIATPKAAGSAS
jgi:RNA polymerase sigma-70 factor, ECF subfamily